MSDRTLFHIAVFNLIFRENKLLMLKRKNSGWFDGYYSIPSGHLEAGELPSEAVVRETKEEVGLVVDIQSVSLVHTSYRNNTDRTYIDLFFETTSWSGDPKNIEEDKSEDVGFVDLDNLPEKIVPETRNVIEQYKLKKNYSEMVFKQYS